MFLELQNIEGLVDYTKETWPEYIAEGLSAASFLSSILRQIVEVSMMGTSRYSTMDQQQFGRTVNRFIVLAEGGKTRTKLAVEDVMYAGSIGKGIDAAVESYEDSSEDSIAATNIENAVRTFQCVVDLGDEDVFSVSKPLIELYRVMNDVR